MTTLSGVDVYRLAIGAGFNADQAVNMVAIARAESGWRTDAVGDTTITNSTWGPSIGLWQIRSLNAQRGTGKERDASRLTDAAFNARAARIVYGQQGYRAWSVYTKGTYGKYLDDAHAAQDAAEGGGGTLAGLPGVPAAGAVGGLLGKVPGVSEVGQAALSSAGGVFKGLDSIGNFFGGLSQRATWVRVLQVTGGTGLITVGLLMLSKDLTGPVLGIATDVIPQARAIKAGGAVLSAGKGAAKKGAQLAASAA